MGRICRNNTERKCYYKNCNELFGNGFFNPTKDQKETRTFSYRNEDGKAIIGKILVFFSKSK